MHDMQDAQKQYTMKIIVVDIDDAIASGTQEYPKSSGDKKLRNKPKKNRKSSCEAKTLNRNCYNGDFDAATQTSLHADHEKLGIINEVTELIWKQSKQEGQ